MSYPTFTPGQSYTITFIGDSDLKVELPIIRRTAQNVWAKVDGEVKRLKVHNHYATNEEFVKPYGTYSMNPTAYAKRVF